MSATLAASGRNDGAIGPAGSRALVWRRFCADRLALAALCVLTLLVLACFVGEPILTHVLGRGPDTPFLSAVDVNLKPVGPFSWVRNTPLDLAPHPGKTLFVLGADGPLGRDELLRLLAGGQVSLEIAFLATLIALVIGGTLGTIGGWFGGFVDELVGWLTELVMAFPLLLLFIAVGQTIANRFDLITIHHTFKPGVLSLGVVLGLFSWFYPARITRALVHALREREFVEASRMTGARESRIIVRHVLPHLAGPLIVWSTLVGAGVIVLEASLSALNFGIRLPTASWGTLLASSWGTLLNFNPQGSATSDYVYPKSAWVLVWPGVALFVTVVCLALIGDGLRAALDPRGDA